MIGAYFHIWIKTLWKNRFNVSFSKFHVLFVITLMTFMQYPLAAIEHLLLKRKIKNTKIEKSPVFIVGHQRSGTTHLHRLMTKDDSFIYPTLIDISYPLVFRYFRKIVTFITKIFMPEQRPMDNMVITVDEPEEHEIAIASFNGFSYIIGYMFLNNFDKYENYGSFEKATVKERKKWTKTFQNFLKKLTLEYGNKILLLKNPNDTERINILLEMFPKSKFIHIYRDPYRVFLSTKKLFIKNNRDTHLQNIKIDLDAFVISHYKKMYEKFYEDIPKIPKGQFIEIKYENLVENPLEELEKIYTQLSIPDFEKAKKNFEIYLNSLREYKVTKYEIDKALRSKIYSELSFTTKKWGYEKHK